MKARNFCLFSLLLSSLWIVSCQGPKQVVYFREDKPNDNELSMQDLPAVPESRIQPDDIISVNVTSISSINEQNPNPVGIFNEGGTRFPLAPMAGGMGMGGSGAMTTGYLVGKDGMIDFPVLGKMQVAGLTVNEAKSMLSGRLKDYVKNPVVEARIINYRVTLMGEVGQPGAIIVPNQKINILEAIAVAGEIPVSGRKDNVLVIREREGKREFARLNLNSKEVFKDPYFNLMQNDIVYVEPNRIRRQESNAFLRFYLPAIASVLTTGLAVYGVVQLSKP